MDRTVPCASLIYQCYIKVTSARGGRIECRVKRDVERKLESERCEIR